uniref:beta-ketoacyl-[acyl-carrier-protein] synthase III n=1 Tax=Nannochloropsis gaditana (strain CCMP526) TaxID=1093141 RepID=I2CQW7_NANGC
MSKRSRASSRGLAYIQRLHLLSLSLCLLLSLQCSIRAAAFLVPSSPLPSLPSSHGPSLPSSRPPSSVPKSQALRMATSLTEGSSVDAPAAVPGRSFLRAKPIGVGSAAPEDVITNTDLESIVETSDEWIFTRTGISQRRILTSGGQIRALAATAAARALASAGLEGKDIDLVVLATSSPDDLFGDATSVAAAVGATQAVAFDLTAACSGFLFGVVSASQFLHSGCYRRALVVGADALSRWVDWEDRNSCILFGDGAGAVVLEAAEGEEDSGVLGFAMHSDGTGQGDLNLQFSRDDSQSPPSIREVTPYKGKYNNIAMNGKEVYKFATRKVPTVIEEALANAGLGVENVDWLLLHQANIRIMDVVADRLGLSKDKILTNLSEYGNTSAGSIPLALDEAVKAAKVKKGDIIACAGFGAGLSWGSAIIRWQG